MILRNKKYCSSAIIQNTFVNFLSHTTMVNNGEIFKTMSMIHTLILFLKKNR